MRRGDPKLVLSVAGRFVAWMVLFSTVLYVEEQFVGARYLLPVLHGSAWLIGQTLALFGTDLTVHLYTIFQGDSAFVVAPECTGIEVMEIFAAAVLAFPASWRARLRGLGIGLGVLVAVNFLRMTTLVAVGPHSQTALEWGHLYIWPVVVIAVAMGLFLYWAEKVEHEARRRV